MNCEDFRKFLDNYENLTEAEKLAMNAHAAECKSCADELDFMLSIIKTAKSLPKIPSPPDFMDNLNIRIDTEEKKKRRLSFRIAANLRRNSKIYTAAAACFALVAVLTANSADLLGRMKPDDNGGVIEQETVVTDSNTPSSSNISRISSDSSDNPASVTASPFAEPTVPALEPAKETEKNISRKDGYTPVPTTKTVPLAAPAPLKKAGKTAASAAPKTEPVKAAASKPAVTASAASKSDFEPTPLPKTDNSVKSALAEIPSEDAPNDMPESYEAEPFSLAMSRASYGSEIAAYSDTPETEESIDVEERYSLAEEGNIAHGQYYRIDKNGNPIKEEQDKAIGQIKISSDDIDKAMDVVRRYSYSVSGDLYETDSTSLSLMLSSFTENGVLYTNYTPAYTGDIRFRLVIG